MIRISSKSLLLTSGLFLSSSVFASSVAELMCSDIGLHLQSDTGRYDVLPSNIQDNIISESPTIYAALTRQTRLTAKKTFFCDDLLDPEKLAECAFDYAFGNSNDYAWYDASQSGTNLRFISGFDDQRRFQYSPASRGIKQVAVVLIDKYFRHSSGSYLSACDVVEVVAHNPPTATSYSASGGNAIRGSISASIDSLSERAQSGLPPLITWELINLTNSGQVHRITTTTSSLTYSPPFAGNFLVSVTINDGNFNTTYNLGEHYYTEGAPCHGDCNQIQ